MVGRVALLRLLQLLVLTCRGGAAAFGCVEGELTVQVQHVKSNIPDSVAKGAQCRRAPLQRVTLLCQVLQRLCRHDCQGLPLCNPFLHR